MIALFSIHHFCISWLRALTTNLNDLKAVRNNIWELIIVLIRLILVIHSSFNWTIWSFLSLFLRSWTPNEFLLTFLFLVFSTVLSTIYIANDIHLVLKSLCINIGRMIWSKFDCLFYRIHCLVSSLWLDGLVEQLISLTLVELFCVFSLVCLLASWFTGLIVIGGIE